MSGLPLRAASNRESTPDSDSLTIRKPKWHKEEAA